MLSETDHNRGVIVFYAPYASDLAGMISGIPDRAFDLVVVRQVSEIDDYMAENNSVLAVVLDVTTLVGAGADQLPRFSDIFLESGGPVLLVGEKDQLRSRDLRAALGISRVVDASHGSDVLYRAICTEVEEYRQRLSVKEAVEKGARAVGDIDRATFRFRTREEAKNLATMLSSACLEPVPIAIGLTELFVNAVEHGCLEIGHGEKGRLIEKGRLAEEIMYRRALPEYADRYVVVEFERFSDKVVFDVIDPGEGFDYHSFIEDAGGHTKKHGRGITMAGGCFDELTYFGNGNHVKATHFLTEAR